MMNAPIELNQVASLLAAARWEREQSRRPLFDRVINGPIPWVEVRRSIQERYHQDALEEINDLHGRGIRFVLGGSE